MLNIVSVMKILDSLPVLESDAIKLDSKFDNCVVGVLFEPKFKMIYSESKILATLIEEEMSLSEAIDHLQYKIKSEVFESELPHFIDDFNV